MLKLSIDGSHFYQGDAPTYTRRTGFPSADPRLTGLLLNHRVVNGIFDDLNPSHDYDGDGRDDWAYADTGRWDPERNTRQFVEAMPVWRAQGVIAFTIGLQGGNPFRVSPPPPGLRVEALDCGAFNEDGSLRPAFMARLKRILDQARELDMAPIVNYFYHGGAQRIGEHALEAAVDNATRWLLEQNYDGLIIDVANECDIASYRPELQLERIHEMIYRIKDEVDLYAARIRQSRRFYASASFTGGYSRAERLATLPAAFIHAADLLLPHGNRCTTEEVRAAIEALRQRVAEVSTKTLPIVYNEDIQAPPEGDWQDYGGDLEHLEACLKVHVSWGNLIRSHQWVPCEDWAGGSAVQAAWYARTRELAGQPNPPSSVLLRYDRI
ncbi:MAG: hypothetical protein JXA74_17850 [Anaerolineae bacterium]|nr:hypothetical protein [Anaerolineae bacterium]